MKTTQNFKRKYKTSIILMSFMLTMVFMNFSPIVSNNDSDSGITDGETVIETYEDPLEEIISSAQAQAEWWSEDFNYRRQINITNPGSDDFVDNYGVSINFNYSELVALGKMNASLKDIRIVENGILRKYYLHVDNPATGNVTIWFENNCSAGATETDTFMYYGNDSVEFEPGYLMDYNPMGVAWYKFDHNAGDTAIRDSIDGQSHAIAGGASAGDWVTGQIDGALDFNRDIWVSLGNQPKLQITMNQTICWWTQVDALYDRQNPYGKAYGGEGTITLEQSGSLSYYYGTNGGNGQSYQGFGSGGGTITTGTWIHVALVRDLTNRVLYWYKNGGIRNSAPATYSPAVAGVLAATIGDNYVRPYDGRIDDLRIYNGALSYDDVNKVMNMNYTLDTNMLSETEKSAAVEITVRDVDGRAIPNVVVSLHNATQDILYSETSNSQGVATFFGIPYEDYNITMNYSLSLGSTIVIYNSTAIDQPVTFQGLHEARTIFTDMWTIDFEVVDWEDEPMNLGLINISTAFGQQVIETLTLDSEGKATFVWENRTSYYYEVYYNNEDYFKQYTLINSSDVVRVDKKDFKVINVNETASGSFFVDEYIWTENNSQTYVGEARIINTTIELKDMTDNLDKVYVFYVNEDKTNVLINELTQTYTTETEDTITATILDSYNGHGLFVEVYGDNSTRCNGTISVNFTQTTHQYIKTNLTKMEIKVIDSSGGNPPVPGVLVRVFNKTDNQSIINLTTSSGEVHGVRGYAYGDTNKIPFWYLRDTYNISLEFFDTVESFNVTYNEPNQWNGTEIEEYNYTLDEAAEIHFKIIDKSGYITEFTAFSGNETVFWGENISYEITYEFSKTGGAPYTPITDPDYITCGVYRWGVTPTLLSELEMVPVGGTPGNFTATFNTTQFSAGSASEIYIVQMSAHKEGYGNPDDVFIPVEIIATPTDLDLHNYSDAHENLADDTISQYYNEKANISISYFLNGTPAARLQGATLSYSWTYGSGSGITEDPLYPGYYTFEIDTSIVPNTGKYGIAITMEKENYTTDSLNIFLDIITRPTTVNGSTTLMHISESLWIEQAHNFTFVYNDTLTNSTLVDLDEAYYYWYKLGADGSPLGAPSANIDLVLTADNSSYVLDFDTELQSVGDYALFITLQKYNYEARNAFIDLRVVLREATPVLTATALAESRITVIQGEDISFSLTLTDDSNDDAPLTGATVKITLDNGDIISFTESATAGTYTATFSTTSVDAFFTANTLIGTLSIEKTNYVTTTSEITIVVNMVEVPFIPGLPLFYFIMIVGAVVAVVGSLVISRAIRSARIPNFIKKSDRIKGAIKGRKSISDSDLYPTKKKVIAKRFGDLWEKLDMDLEDILGIKITKAKKMPDMKDETGGAIE